MNFAIFLRISERYFLIITDKGESGVVVEIKSSVCYTETIRGNKCDVSGGIMKKDSVRRVLLVAVSILNWIFSVGFIREIYDVMLGNNLIEYVDNIDIDGSDFTPLANLAVDGANGLIILIGIGASVLFATIFISIFAILLRVTTIRKKDTVTESEVIFTKWLIIVSSILAFIVGILSTNIKLIVYVIGLSWQQPLFMMLIYYLPLKNQFKKGTEITHSEL